MKANVRSLDRGLRAGAGVFLLATPLLNLPTYPFNLLGVVLLLTGVFGYCPLYMLASRIGRALSLTGGSSLRRATH